MDLLDLMCKTFVCSHLVGWNESSSDLHLLPEKSVYLVESTYHHMAMLEYIDYLHQHEFDFFLIQYCGTWDEDSRIVHNIQLEYCYLFFFLCVFRGPTDPEESSAETSRAGHIYVSVSPLPSINLSH